MLVAVAPGVGRHQGDHLRDTTGGLVVKELRQRIREQESSHVRADREMARPGFEPGTPRFSVVWTSFRVRPICSHFRPSRVPWRRPRFAALCGRFPGDKARGRVRGPFRRAEEPAMRLWRGPAAERRTGRSSAPSVSRRRFDMGQARSSDGRMASRYVMNWTLRCGPSRSPGWRDRSRLSDSEPFLRVRT